MMRMMVCVILLSPSGMMLFKKININNKTFTHCVEKIYGKLKQLSSTIDCVLGFLSPLIFPSMKMNLEMFTKSDW